MPEFSGILAALNITPARRVTREFNINNPALNGRIIRAAAQKTHGLHGGAIITFDDITDLLTAQRNAAWSDIARRIAHEIKNPLTPIQLSAERLQARYGQAADDDQDIFKQCTILSSVKWKISVIWSVLPLSRACRRRAWTGFG